MASETAIRTRGESRRDVHHEAPVDRPQHGRNALTQAPLAEHLTLLELVEAVSSVTEDDAEVVATVSHMLRSGSVKLSGSFRELAPIHWVRGNR
jgi:hypothetical protein